MIALLLVLMSSQMPIVLERAVVVEAHVQHARIVRERRCRIQEDDPRWNCHTMGNRRCG